MFIEGWSIQNSSSQVSKIIFFFLYTWTYLSTSLVDTWRDTDASASPVILQQQESSCFFRHQTNTFLWFLKRGDWGGGGGGGCLLFGLVWFGHSHGHPVWILHSYLSHCKQNLVSCHCNDTVNSGHSDRCRLSKGPIFIIKYFSVFFSLISYSNCWYHYKWVSSRYYKSDNKHISQPYLFLSLDQFHNTWFYNRSASISAGTCRKI